MEAYKIVATCNNYAGTGNPRTFDWLPENFHGVKIMQKFSFINPIGYTPKFSVETMRTIAEDKTWIDNIFDLYGFESNIEIAIYKLNSTGDDYALKSTFLVDMDSYSKQDYYSEFALKSISCIEQYNETKSTARKFTGAAALAVPTTNTYINRISVKKDTGGTNNDNTGYLNLVENETSKVYNEDSALYMDIRNVYEFHRDGTANLDLKAVGQLAIYAEGTLFPGTISIGLYKNDYSNLILDLGGTISGQSYGYGIEIDEKYSIDDLAFERDDVLFIGVVHSSTGVLISDIFGSFSLEMYVSTPDIANEFGRKIYYLTSESILDAIFDDQATIETALKTIGVTSSQSILKRLTYISLIPKDFMTDFCLANGAIINFKNDGTVEIAKIDTYFAALLDKANAIEITNFQNVEIMADTSLNFVSVSAGMSQKKCDVYTYLNDWNKILTFNQSARAASENLSLQLTKFRVDYSGILDYITKIATSTNDTSSDVFLFDPSFTPRTTNEGIIYDQFTPRDILENWRKFLEFIFYNYSKDTLVLSDNSGDDFNLEIEAGVHQFDNFVFSGDNPKILPLKINFTCLIDETDFTEKILKINYKGEDLFIFVTEAETTDNLSEQKIKGNLIYFPELT